MKKLNCELLLLLWVAIFAAGQASARDASAERSMLIALENAWNQAQMHRDGEAHCIGPNGGRASTLLNKAKFIADSKDTSVETTLVANDDVRVYFYPGFAVVTGAYHAKGTNQGKPFDHYGRFTDTWIFTDGQWRCVASHTNLTKKTGTR